MVTKQNFQILTQKSHFLLGCPNSPLCEKVLNACMRLNVIPELKYVLTNTVWS